MLLLSQDPLIIAATMLSVVVAITVHEFAHALSADLAGDPTPRATGRISLNPLNHFDLIGTIMFLFFGFGWAKPVQINPALLRHPRRDSMLIALWGPLSNFLTAIVFGLLLRFVTLNPYGGLNILLNLLVLLSINLGVFNLLPIFPLDGSHIVTGLLPADKAYRFSFWSARYGMILLVVFLVTRGFQVLFTYVCVPLYVLIVGPYHALFAR